MKLDTQVGLGPGHTVLNGDPASAPHMLWPNVWTDQDSTWYRTDLGPSDIMLDGDPAPLPKKGQSPQIFSPCLLWPNGWMDQDAT